MLAVYFFTLVTFGRVVLLTALALSFEQSVRVFRNTNDTVVKAKAAFIGIWSFLAAVSYATVIATSQATLNGWQQPVIIYGVASVITGWVWLSVERTIWQPDAVKQIEKLREALPPHVTGEIDDSA
jgi:hypothetical protein